MNIKKIKRASIFHPKRKSKKKKSFLKNIYSYDVIPHQIQPTFLAFHPIIQAILQKKKNIHLYSKPNILDIINVKREWKFYMNSEIAVHARQQQQKNTYYTQPQANGAIRLQERN